MSDVETEDRAKKERSPSFPFITLRKAIERAEAMMASHRRSATRIIALAETWGYSASSSGLIQTVAALKAYGLLADAGKGDDRRVQLSDLALRLLTDDRPGAKDNAIRDAATRPKLLKEHLDTWTAARPSDSHCISELTLDRGFTREAAKGFLRVFDDNISFAALKGDDKTEPVFEEEATVEDYVTNDGAPKISADAARKAAAAFAAAMHASKTAAPQVPFAPKVPAATLPLPEGIVSLSVPSGLSERSMKTLKAWLDVVVEMGAWQVEKSEVA